MTFRLALLTTGLTAAAPANSENVAKDLAGLAPASGVRVIVQYRHDPNPGEFKRLANSGATGSEALPNVHAVLVEVSAPALKGIGESPEVLYISPDRELRGSMDFTAATTEVVLVSDPVSAWPQAGGLSAVWGSLALAPGASAAWGNSAAWGSFAASGSSAGSMQEN